LKNNQIGIIGVGYWGTNIVNVLQKIGVKNIYCHDKISNNLKEIKKKFPKVKIEYNYKKFLNYKHDGVIIAINTNSHFQVAKDCLNKGFNIFVEKPVTNSIKKLKYLDRLAKSKNLFILGGYIYFYNDYIRYIKKILKKKYLGKIYYASCERLNLGPVRNDINSAWDLSSHDIAICNYLFEKNLSINNIYGYDFLKKKINDITSISARIDSIKLDIRSSWLNPEKIRKIIIVGKKKMLLFNELDFNSPIKIYNKYANYPKINNFKKDFFTQKANIYYGSTFIPKIKFSSPLENEMKEFLKCLYKNKKPLISTKILINIMKTLEKLK
tara:strand:+ start:601 stop:1578 length:978 start_codon:yes stop_codon:yes gene_type:complete